MRDRLACWPSISSISSTKGGPDNTTVTVVQLIYREAFQRQNLGTAAAISVVVLLALLVLNAVQFLQLRDPGKELTRWARPATTSAGPPITC